MADFKKRLLVQGVLLRQGFERLQTGGDWAASLPPALQQNLRYFFFDGFFSSASDNIWVTYLVVFFLALGATQEQIGLMSSISSLAAAASLMPGALLVERIGRRKDITVIGGGGIARLTMPLIALAPLFIYGPGLVTAVIALAIVHDLFANLAYPAWMSLTGDLVPVEGRGRYFSSRTIAMAFIGMAVVFIAGQALARVPQPVGYQVAFGAAFLLGMCSTFSFARITDPAPQAPLKVPRVKGEARQAIHLASITQGVSSAWSDLRAHPQFLVLLIAGAFWNFSLNIAGPFFNVYMVQHLHADAAMIGLTSIASTVATMLVQRKMGQLNDRWGARKLMMVMMLSIPAVPFMWVFVREAWNIIPINLVSGALWSGFNLASFNYLLAQAPSEQRARYSAIFQMTMMLSLAVGAAVGSLVVTAWGFLAVFALSALGRLLSGLLFARLSKEERPLPQPV